MLVEVAGRTRCLEGRVIEAMRDTGLGLGTHDEACEEQTRFVLVREIKAFLANSEVLNKFI